MKTGDMLVGYGAILVLWWHSSASWWIFGGLVAAGFALNLVQSSASMDRLIEKAAEKEFTKLKEQR